MAAATDVLAVVVKLNELKLKGERKAVALRWFMCVYMWVMKCQNVLHVW